VRSGAEFIIEGDEYDTAYFDKGPKFLHYMPWAVLLTHVEFDHADIYKDLDAVKVAFKRLINLVPQRGKLIAFDGSANVKECVAKAFAPVEFYGFEADSTWRARDLEFSREQTRWSVERNGKPWAKFQFPLAGAYNVLNATGAAATAAHFGIEPKAIQEALFSFKSVKRRLEVIAEVNGVTIIDDFAHHPTAIAATLEALRARYAGRRLVAIFEPRSNTLRRKIFERELVDALALADEIVVASVFKPEAVPEVERLEVETIVASLLRAHKPARQLRDADEITATISPELKPGDVVVILSNGGFGDIYRKLPNALRSRAAVTA
jgi:UDP-N-acetylmuramate: L-alanyl-gamma-D-glutamyl-meso-diaminopimelate ligase